MAIHFIENPNKGGKPEIDKKFIIKMNFIL